MCEARHPAPTFMDRDFFTPPPPPKKKKNLEKMNEILSYIYCDDFGFHTMQVIHIIPYTMSYT